MSLELILNAYIKWKTLIQEIYSNLVRTATGFCGFWTRTHSLLPLAAQWGINSIPSRPVQPRTHTSAFLPLRATCLALRLTPGREKEAGVPFFHPGPKCGTDATGAQITPAPAHGVGVSYREVSKQIQGYCQHPPPTLLPPRHSAPRARVSPKRQVHHCPHPQHKSWGSESAQGAKQTL